MSEQDNAWLFSPWGIPANYREMRGSGVNTYKMVNAEVEQVAFGTGVLVDGLDFSDDKLLQGRTFSYSDTQRHRVGANYLQLPVNRPKTHVATNQGDGQMAHHVDGVEAGENPHVNYEPSSKTDSLREAPRVGKDHTPFVSGNIVRQKIERQNNYGQSSIALPRDGGLGARRVNQQPRQPCRAVRPRYTGTHGLAPLAVRRGVRPPHG